MQFKIFTLFPLYSRKFAKRQSLNGKLVRETCDCFGSGVLRSSTEETQIHSWWTPRVGVLAAARQMAAQANKTRGWKIVRNYHANNIS